MRFAQVDTFSTQRFTPNAAVNIQVKLEYIFFISLVLRHRLWFFFFLIIQCDSTNVKAEQCWVGRVLFLVAELVDGKTINSN